MITYSFSFLGNNFTNYPEMDWIGFHVFHLVVYGTKAARKENTQSRWEKEFPTRNLQVLSALPTFFLIEQQRQKVYKGQKFSVTHWMGILQPRTSILQRNQRFTQYFARQLVAKLINKYSRVFLKLCVSYVICNVGSVSGEKQKENPPWSAMGLFQNIS